jgi:orotidine-5'-phosphate decarboxylase
MSNHSRVCLAFDGMKTEDVYELADLLGDSCYALKLHDAVDREGPDLVLELNCDHRVWVDYKLHDTDGTVGLRAKALSDNGATVITVHASGGVRMMQAAVKETRQPDGSAYTEIWAVTILTSLDDGEIGEIYGKERTREQIVIDLALLAKKADVDGIVCSALEVKTLATHPKLRGMKFIVPGTRSTGVDLGQQRRSATPAQAIEDGATLLVAASQVTKADDPVAAFVAFVAETQSAAR